MGNNVSSVYSAYKTAWLVFTAENGGAVVREDIRRIEGMRAIGPGKRSEVHLKHFPDVDSARRWLASFDGSTLKKAYRVRMCYDAQLSRVRWPERLPKFTRKQEEEAVIIGRVN